MKRFLRNLGPLSRLQDPVVRRKFGFYTAKTESFSIHVARSVEDYAAAFGLLHVAYVFQGYEWINPSGMRITDHHLLPEATVYVAKEGDQVVGTMTTTEDSPAGLPLDADFPEELEQLRRRGMRLVEVGSLAVVKRCWHTGVAPMLALAGVRNMMRRMNNWTHAVIGAHPKAKAYYRALWAFRPIAGPREHSRLEAPVVLYLVSRDEVRRHFERYFKKPMKTGYSPYGYLFEDVPWIWPEDLPEGMTLRQLGRWKLPREVFRELFLQRSRKIQRISPTVDAYLRSQRTEQTTDFALHRRARTDAMKPPVLPVSSGDIGGVPEVDVKETGARGQGGRREQG